MKYTILVFAIVLFILWTLWKNIDPGGCMFFCSSNTVTDETGTHTTYN